MFDASETLCQFPVSEIAMETRSSSSRTDACSSSLFLESPLFFLGSFSFLDMDPEVLFLKGSLPPPEPLPYFDEGMLICQSRWFRVSNLVLGLNFCRAGVADDLQVSCNNTSYTIPI